MELEHVVQVSSCVLRFDVSICDDILFAIVDDELELLTDLNAHIHLKGAAIGAVDALKLLAPSALSGPGRELTEQLYT